MAFERIEVGKEADFVAHWSGEYKAAQGGFDFAQVSYENADERNGGTIDYYAELNIAGDLSKRNVKRLLRWKDQRFLTSEGQSDTNAGCPNVRVERVVAHLNAINAFRAGDLTEEREAAFDAEIGDCFPSGRGVWRTFAKHIARPWDFPIYDRHVWGAYCRLNGKPDGAEVPPVTLEGYGEYREFFLSLYRAVYGTDGRVRDKETVERMKRIDNALFAYDEQHGKK